MKPVAKKQRSRARIEPVPPSIDAPPSNCGRRILFTDKEDENYYRDHWFETTFDYPVLNKLIEAERAMSALSTVSRVLRIDDRNQMSASGSGVDYTPLDHNIRGGLYQAQCVLTELLWDVFEEMHEENLKEQP
jgi:hypothetical protein